MELIDAFVDVFLESAPYLLLGFFIAGLLKSLFKDSFIQKHMGESSTKSVVNAALIGIPLPLCSCGVIPAAISLKDKGASKGASMSFLISTPQSGVDSIAISYGLLGPFITLFRPISGFIAAFFSGLIENRAEEEIVEVKSEIPVMSCCSSHVDVKVESVAHAHVHEGSNVEFNLSRQTDTVVENEYEPIPDCCSPKMDEHDHHESHSESSEEESTYQKAWSGLRYAFGDLSNDIALHLLIGFALAAIISAILPDSFFQEYMDNEFLSLFAMLIIGIPMYICATASTPIAAAMLLKGLSPGAALVFLLAGPATNIASIVVLQNKFGKKAIFRMIAVIILTAITMGYILNLLAGLIDLQIPLSVIGGMHMDHFTLLNVSSAVVLSYLIMKGIWVENLKKYIVN